MFTLQTNFMKPMNDLKRPNRESRVSRVPRQPLSISSLILAVLLTPWCAPAQIQQAWVARYNNGITNGTNQAIKMALDTNGSIYVSGFSQNTDTNLGYVAIKYAPNGNQLWAARYDSTNYPLATPSGLVLDNNNNVIITGSGSTIKYDSNGNQIWTAPYAGSALAVDSNRNVVVTGISTQFGTVKLDANGSNIWTAIYPSSYGPGVGQQVLIAPDSSIYVAGYYTSLCQGGMCYEASLIIKYVWSAETVGKFLWLGELS
jgi:hypothetical protein